MEASSRTRKLPAAMPKNRPPVPVAAPGPVAGSEARISVVMKPGWATGRNLTRPSFRWRHRTSRWHNERVDSRRLRAFVMVAELGGITAAADRLGYAQSSLSAQLRSLETELGVAVLRRTNAGVSLTE